jgi:amylosucrase
MEVIDTGNIHVFGFVREFENQKLLIVNNFSDYPQSMSENRLRVYGLGYRFVDHVSGHTFSANEPLYLGPYGFVWLETTEYTRPV